MTAMVRTSSNCKRQTSPIVKEGARHQQTRNRLAVIKISSWVPHGCLIPRQTGRLTVGRNFDIDFVESCSRECAGVAAMRSCEGAAS
jgi:hypothetical protein